VQFVDGEMLTGFKEGPQDGAALSGMFEADALEMAEENFLGFADVLARDGRLIVDSVLQHVGRRGHSKMIMQCRGFRHDTRDKAAQAELGRGTLASTLSEFNESHLPVHGCHGPHSPLQSFK
jgi:hypothetical protein